MGLLIPGIEGDRIGPYRLIELIRRGGQGRVYLGYDDRLRRRVAIKLLSRPRSRVARKLLVREARTVATLDSPHLVKIYDVVVASPYLALVMEYVPGCDLEQLLTVTKLSQPSILSIASDLASALAAARRHGIVHGDVKAANVLITQDGRAKLTDFGIARDSATTADVGAGSPSAISPEQLRGEALDVRADLFALGCLMYRMLSGEHPYFRDGRLDTQQLQTGAPVAPELAVDGTAINPELRALVVALLDPSPEQRPANTHEVRRILRTVRRSMPVGLGDTLLDEARPWFRRERADLETALTTVDSTDPGIELSEVVPVSRRQLRAASGLALLVALVLVVGWMLMASPLRVQVNAPAIVMSKPSAAPEPVDANWLRAEVLAAAGKAVTTATFVGVAAGPVTTLSTVAAAAEAVADESLDIALRCNAQFCLLELARERRNERWRQQATLLPGDALAHWRDVVHSATRALYAR